MLFITFKALHGFSPGSVAKFLLLPCEPECSLRSSDWALLAVYNSRRKTKGDQALVVNDPQLWNSPNWFEDLRLKQSVTYFNCICLLLFIITRLSNHNLCGIDNPYPVILLSHSHIPPVDLKIQSCSRCSWCKTEESWNFCLCFY